ncbi:MAG TPA: hypothetical protein VLF67_01220 [Candidatus Saccharimonas sp.]|nr:hypothetical protein [Candidatus Saccharimonas sp.]
MHNARRVTAAMAVVILALLLSAASCRGIRPPIQGTPNPRGGDPSPAVPTSPVNYKYYRLIATRDSVDQITMWVTYSVGGAVQGPTPITDRTFSVNVKAVPGQVLVINVELRDPLPISGTSCHIVTLRSENGPLDSEAASGLGNNLAVNQRDWVTCHAQWIATHDD